MKNAKACKTLITTYLESMVGTPEWEGEMYQPMSYILSMGGKRIRPVLLLLTYQAVTGESPEPALGPASSVELFHNFTLMHDDIMDNAPVRRGMATVHEKWDRDTAILAGDAMFAIAMQNTVTGFPAQAGKLIAEFSRIAVGVCEGQMEDLTMAGLKGVTEERYIEMIRKKTAMLLGGSMSLGAIAAGADSEVVNQLYAYGESMGIGFQLQDDYLDVYADAEKFGKQVGGDILENKMTFLLIRALELASGETEKELHRLLFREENAEAKVAGVMEVYAELGIPEITREKTEGYFRKAREIGKELSRFEGFAHISQYLEALTQREY